MIVLLLSMPPVLTPNSNWQAVIKGSKKQYKGTFMLNPIRGAYSVARGIYLALDLLH